MRIPAGYECLAWGGAEAFAKPELRTWVEEALAAGSLYEHARRSALHSLEGRAPVYVVSAGGVARAVRHYWRGGVFAPVLNDRYFRVGRCRPARELMVSIEARRREIPTPEVVAGAIYPAGLFYRAELLTNYVPDSRNLGHILFGPDREAGVRREEALLASVALISLMASAGLRHPDVNAQNVLVTPGPAGLEAHIVDLDRAALRTRGSVGVERMARRLERSLRKSELASGHPLAPDEWRLFRSGFDRPGAVGRGAA